MQKQLALPFLALNKTARDKFPLLPKSAITVFLYLADKAPRIFPKQTTIARETFLSDRTVRRSLKILEALKMIKRTKFYKCPTVYEINPELIHSEKKRFTHKMAAEGMRIFFSRVAKEHGRRFYNAIRRTISAEHNQNKSIYNYRNRKKLDDGLFRTIGLTLKTIPQGF